jgi:L-aspartate oxidase
MWENAGIERARETLEALLDDPNPLAALVARFGLAREESRGVHQRVDHPRSDPALDRHHLVAAPSAETPAWETWD